MEKTGLTRRQIFVFVTIILFFIAGVTVVYLYSLQNRAKNDIKEVVAKKIDRKDFEVTEIVVEADGWQLARIASTAKQDEGNPAMVILHEENNQLVLKFGPGKAGSGRRTRSYTVSVIWPSTRSVGPYRKPFALPNKFLFCHILRQVFRTRRFEQIWRESCSQDPYNNNDVSCSPSKYYRHTRATS